MTTTKLSNAPQAVTDYIQDISQDQDRWLEFYGTLTRKGREAGIKKERMLDSVNRSYEDSQHVNDPGGTSR